MRRWLTAAAAILVLLAVNPAIATSSGDITIVRDEFGVPHIYAETETDLFYAFGYIQAQDRLWQAEVLRRQGTGTLAELFGEDSLASDAQSRLLFGPPSRRADLFAAATPQVQAMLTAHAAGINAWIDEAGALGRLPIEYGLFGIAPRPWTVDDTIATFMAIGSNFGWFGSDELNTAATYGALVAALGPEDAAEVFADTHWLDDPDAPTTVPATGSHDPAVRASAPQSIDPAARRAAGEVATDRAAARIGMRRAGLDTDGHSSNAAVIGATLSRDGVPLLLGGPQMGYSAPQINHEVGLHGAGFDVTGMTIAGFPLVPIGVAHGLAWTLTSGGSDNTDIFAEQLNPANPTQYLHNGVWHDMDCRTEDVPVAGVGAVPQTFCRTVHGPVIFADGTTAYALQNVTYGHELQSLDAWTRLGTAGDIDEFSAGLADVAYNFNVLYADDDGNIAYWHIGHIPIRADGVNPLFPTPGTGEYEWQGVLPFDQNPHSLNPDQGWLASWNNKPAPGWINSSADFWRWGGAHRVNTFIGFLEDLHPGSASTRTLELLNRTGGWTTDTPTGQASSVFVSSYFDEMLAAVDRSADPRLDGVAHLLKGWDHQQKDRDGDGFYDSPGGAIFNAWWQAISDQVFADDTAGLINRFVVGNLVDRMYAGTDAALPLIHDYLDGATVEEATTAALISALDELTATYSSPDPADWLQPISVIHWSPIGAGAVPDTIWMNRGTYNQIVYLGAGSQLRAQNVIAPGQSGDPLSPHFADQLELYATWHYKPMHLTERDVRRNAESVTVIVGP